MSNEIRRKTEMTKTNTYNKIKFNCTTTQIAVFFFNKKKQIFSVVFGWLVMSNKIRRKTEMTKTNPYNKIKFRANSIR